MTNIISNLSYLPESFSEYDKFYCFLLKDFFINFIKDSYLWLMVIFLLMTTIPIIFSPPGGMIYSFIGAFIGIFTFILVCIFGFSKDGISIWIALYYGYVKNYYLMKVRKDDIHVIMSMWYKSIEKNDKSVIGTKYTTLWIIKDIDDFVEEKLENF